MGVVAMGLFKALAGLAYGHTVSPKVWGKKLLAQELRDRGDVDTALIPDACLQELADDAIHIAQLIAQMQQKKCRISDMIGAIENMSTMVAAFLDHDYDDVRDSVRQILERHGVVSK
jgi:hypothetical protein